MILWEAFDSNNRRSNYSKL